MILMYYKTSKQSHRKLAVHTKVIKDHNIAVTVNSKGSTLSYNTEDLSRF